MARRPLPASGRGIAFGKKTRRAVPLRPILRDARLWRAPQDEASSAAKTLTLMVRSAACGASRTMEAEDIRGRQTPYAIALPRRGASSTPRILGAVTGLWNTGSPGPVSAGPRTHSAAEAL